MPDLSKVGEKLKSLKDLKGNVKDKIKLPKLQSKSKLPLEYNLSSFLEVYAGPRHGTEPTAHPKHDRSHADFDPFEIPMPTLKAEWSPEDAFAKVGAPLICPANPYNLLSLSLSLSLSRSPLFACL